MFKNSAKYDCNLFLLLSALPVVQVSPVTQTHLTGSDIELKCHAEGVPEPVITWKRGKEMLEYSPHITHYCK